MLYQAGGLRSAPAPKPAAAAKPAEAKKGGLFSMFGGAKPAAQPAAAKPAAAAKPLPARPAPVQRGALRGTMRITK